jgi:hypothetical protein
MKITHKIILTSTALILGLLGSAQAAVVTANTRSATAFTVSSTDLLQTSLGNMNDSSLNWTNYQGNLTELNDGVSTTGAADYLFVTVGTLDFNFDLTANTAGYEINQIDTFTGNSGYNRVVQNYTVSYATVAAPTTFIDIATFDEAMNYSLYEAKGSITEDSTGILASNVATIRYVFPLQSVNGVQYKEIDIIGFASIPEPGTYALIAGMLGLSYVMVRRRR